MGVSPRRLGGWEPSRTITYLFDRSWWKPWSWLPVGARVVVEPEWSLTDVHWLIASRDFEAGMGSHGHPLDEATSADANPANPDSTYFYAAGPAPDVDWAERARLNAQQTHRATLRDDESANGMYFPVRKVWRN